MARTAHSSPIAHVAEIARYLAVDADDVQRMIRVAKMPATRIPQKTRTVFRIPLRDFHAWFLARAVNPVPQLAKYETFLADFDQSARARKPAASTP